MPTSSFGQSIMPSSTGGSNHSASRGFGQQQQKPQDMDDLLGDTDPEVSKNLTNDSTELAHLSNQIGSLTEQTQELNNKRVTAESDLTTLTTQKQNIEAQLAYLRTMYEQEAARVRQVEEQLAASRNDTAKVAQEYQLLEAEYNQLQHKHQEVSSQLEADKRENENLKEMMNQINSESRSLKEELERLNLLAKRERGMVAINKKQAEKGEQEREKLKNGIEEASRVTSPVPPASPTLSQSSNTNPFYRNKSPTALEYPSSPFGQVKQQAPPSMDDVFGSFSPTPPPPASFGRIAQDSNSYTPSLPESGNGGRSTPPTSPGPSSYHGSPQPSEAPAPAAGTQITSAFLPLPFNRAESMTSSTVANPTASVRDTEASRPDTPTNWAGSTAAETPIRERDAFVKAEDRRGSFSVKSDAGTEASGTGRTAFSPFDRRTESPFAQVERNITGTTSGGDENKPKLERVDSLREMGSVPGAFPGIEGAPIKAMATGESNKSNRRYDPFNSLNKDETRSNSSKDFEDAFRALGPAAEHHTGGSGSVSTSRFHDEFPPIVEVRPDSDSESEGGFEDNFTTTSPVQAQKSGTGALTSVPVEGSPAPPSVTAQQPPPAFNQDKSPYTSEFGGLLPSNTDSMKHDAPTPGGSTSAVIFPMPVNSTTAPVTIQDDFDDDAFGDLADAKEADDKSADDFGTSSAFDDFNPVFDSHPKSQNPGMSIDDDDDFAKFSFNIDQSQAHGESPIVPATTSSPQDWDAIFAGIGDPTKEANGTVDQSGMDSGEGGVSISDPTLTAINSAPVGAATTAEGGAIGIDDEKVTKLTGMGFDRENSLKALEKNGWDIDRVSGPAVR